MVLAIHGSTSALTAAVASSNLAGCDNSNEPNNTPATATGAIAYGSTTPGCIDPPGDDDWFRFSATAGDVISTRVRAGAIGSSLDPTLTLIDKDGTTILTFNDDESFPANSDSRLNFCLPSTGTFFLRVQGFAETSTGEYELVLDQIPTNESEPNNNFTTAEALPPGCPATAVGCIAPALDTDFWAVTVPAAGVTYTINMDAPDLPFGPPDAFLILYDTDGTTLLTFDEDSGPGLGAQIIFTFAAPGTYFIEAASSPLVAPLDFGVYSLTVSGGTHTALHTNGLRVDARCGGTGDFGFGGWSEYRPEIAGATANQLFEGHFGYYDGVAVDDGDDTGADIVPACFKLYAPSSGPADEKTADFINEHTAPVMRGNGTGLEIQQFTYLNDLRADGTAANWTLVQTRVFNNTGSSKHVKWYKHLEMDIQPSFDDDVGDVDVSRNLVYQFNDGGAGPFIGMALILGNLTNYQVNTFGGTSSPNTDDAARAAFMDGLNGGNLAPGAGDRNVSLAADLGIIPHGGCAEIWWVIGAGNSLAELQADVDDAKLALLKYFFTLYADTRLKFDDYGNSEGLVGSNASVRFEQGQPSRHTGDVWAAGNINVQPKNTIQGNLTARNAVHVDRSAKVNGVISAGAGFPGLVLPVLNFTKPPSSARTVLVEKDKAANLTPGIYNVVRVEQHGVLPLRSGVYTMNNLWLEDEARLALNLSGGPVTINVANILSSAEEVTIKINSAAGTSRDILINYKGTTPFHLGKGSQFRGSLIAPNARVEVSVGAVHKGMICAKEIAVLDRARILSHDVPGELSKSSLTLEEGSDLTSEGVITSYALSQNYPNPFNPSTRISFDLPRSGIVKLKIYDVLGSNVRTLVNKNMSAGQHEVFWNGHNQAGEQVTAGIYVYRLIVEHENGEPAVILARKMTLLK
jgi:cytoskeletal protein CcmA (bactofilin family)